MIYWKNKLKLSTLKIAFDCSIVLNSICIALGLYYILSSNYSIFWDIFGVIFLITIFGNLILIF
ncbi:MAG: hypothetical protein ACFE9Z_14115, partial [Promethearchaeota archaeon]